MEGLSELDRLQAEVATLRQILEVHERTTYEQALKSEEALESVRREEERYRSLAAATAAVVWIINEAGEFITPQVSWEAYTGQSWEEHRGLGWGAALHPEDRARVIGAWESGRAGRKQFKTEGRLFHAASGEYRFFVARVVPIMNSDGTVREWIGTVTDVDEQHRAAEALRLSDERFRVVSRATNDAVWDWNLTTDALWWNDAVSTLFGYATEDVAPVITWWYDHCHPEDRDRVVGGIHEVIDGGGTTWTDEYRFLRADGRYLDMLDRGFVIREESGKPLRMVGAMQDITERRRRTVQLRKLSQISAVINSNLATDDILQRVTDAARELIGTHQAVSSLTIDDESGRFIHAISLSDEYATRRASLEERDGEEIRSILSETNQATRLTQKQVEAHPRWNGESGGSRMERPVNGWLAAPLTGRDGRARGLIELSDKYSGELTTEDEGILAQLAQAAASAIENARLYEEARSANKAKDDFFAVLSHELRTPMTSIMGWTQLLTADVDRETLEEAVTAIGTSASTQAQLIDDLLDVSRMMAGKLSIEREPLNLSLVAAEVVTAMKPAAAARGVLLALSACEECRVTGDNVRLRQVVSNLISNGIKFTPRGGIVTTSIVSEKDSVVLRVVDTGEGMPREFLSRVFERHAQRISGRHGGLGLGLAIVKNIVDQHGGTVDVESPGEGKGTTFTVRLPRAAGM
ncbi:MAG TPA: PAS domain-containing protein [Thermoanaerobaculia bacterium]|nr:PAS domain-containing protein [Thermoanaerobaculia bacterium]